MIEIVTDFEEFKRKISTTYSVHHAFRHHPSSSGLHIHFDMTCPSKSYHPMTGKSTHIVRFKHRHIERITEFMSEAQTAIDKFFLECVGQFVKPLNSTEGNWI